MSRKINWKDLPIEIMSKLGLFNGKIFKTVSPLNELITIIRGNDRYTKKLLLISESTNMTYMKYFNTDHEIEIFCIELIILLLTKTCEEAAKELEMTKVE